MLHRNTKVCYVDLLRRIVMLRKIYEVMLRRIHSMVRDVASKVRKYQVIVRSYVTYDSLKLCYVESKLNYVEQGSYEVMLRTIRKL